MALQSLGGGLVRFPSLQFREFGGSPQTIDADGESIAAVMVNPHARTIRGFTVTVLTLGAAGTLRFTAETVSAGLPTGALVDASATVDVNIAATGLVKADFGANITLPAGIVAFRVKRVSGTFDGAIVLLFAAASSMKPPHSIVVGGTIDERAPALAHPFSGVPPDEAYLAFPCSVPSWSAQSTTGIVSGDEAGALLTIPFKARAHGIELMVRQIGTPSTNPEVRLYSSDGSTLVASGAFLFPAGDLRAQYAPFAAPADIAPGGYYIAVHCFDTINSVQLGNWDILDRAMAATTGLGHMLTRTGSSGPWTDNDKVPMMALVLDQLEDGVGTTPARADVHLGVI